MDENKTLSGDQPSNDYANQALRVIKDRGFYGVTLPITRWVDYDECEVAANFNAPFFIANRKYQVIQVTERHLVPTNAVNSGLAVLIVSNGASSPGGGNSVISPDYGINMGAVRNTNITCTVDTGSPSVRGKRSFLNVGDSLCLDTNGDLTGLKGVTVSVVLRAI